MASQLHELVTNETLISMFPNLNTLASICLTIPIGTALVERSFSQMKMIQAYICLTIPIGTASVERSFSQMKMIKTRLRSRLGEKSLSHLMKITIESPEKLSENIVDIWYRKSRRIIV